MRASRMFRLDRDAVPGGQHYCLPSGYHADRPIRYDLMFERFLNPDRISMPDFDIDFCAQKARQGD